MIYYVLKTRLDAHVHTHAIGYILITPTTVPINFLCDIIEMCTPSYQIKGPKAYEKHMKYSETSQHVELS